MKLEEYKKKKTRYVIGLMSGTSVDGVDAALVEIRGSFIKTKVRLIKYICVPFEDKTKKAIFEAFRYDKINSARLSGLNFHLGKVFAAAALSVAKKAGVPLREIDLISSHGQTIYHNPPYSTLQIGEGACIAQASGCLVASDFRAADLAAGGQAAPLVPYVDYILFSARNKNRVVLNIGGISNITFLKKNGRLDDVVAFDTGPGNMIVDSLIKIFTKGKSAYDKGGAFAFRGKIDYNLLSRLLHIKYFKLKPPKSTGRETFGEGFTRALLNQMMKRRLPCEDLVATISAFTPESIIYGINKYIKEPVDEIIISGGGAKNKFFTDYLRGRLAGTEIYPSDDFGIPSDAKEAIAFAVLGNETALGHWNNVPSVTGARNKVILGKISQGSGTKVAKSDGVWGQTLKIAPPKAGVRHAQNPTGSGLRHPA